RNVLREACGTDCGQEAAVLRQERFVPPKRHPVRKAQAAIIEIEPGEVMGSNKAGKNGDFHESIADNRQHDQIETFPAQFTQTAPFGKKALSKIKSQVATCWKPLRRKIEYPGGLVGQRGQFGRRKCFSQYSDERNHPQAVANTSKLQQQDLVDFLWVRRRPRGARPPPAQRRIKP